jgi:hypothetical protein
MIEKIINGFTKGSIFIGNFLDYISKPLSFIGAGVALYILGSLTKDVILIWVGRYLVLLTSFYIGQGIALIFKKNAK